MTLDELENKFNGKYVSTDEYAIAQNAISKATQRLENITMNTGSDYLLLKWGSIKGWGYDNNPDGQKLMDKYMKLGMSASAMLQENTQRQKEIMIELIDVTEGTIQNDWDGLYYTKQQAKDYIINYGSD